MNFMIRNRFSLMGIVFCLLAVGQTAQAQNEAKNVAVPHLSVTGKGEVNVRPDKMDVTIGVVTENASSSIAASANATVRMAKAAGVKLNGILELTDTSSYPPMGSMSIARADASVIGGGTLMSPGEMTITANVTLTYNINNF